MSKRKKYRPKEKLRVARECNNGRKAMPKQGVR